MEWYLFVMAELDCAAVISTMDDNFYLEPVLVPECDHRWSHRSVNFHHLALIRLRQYKDPIRLEGEEKRQFSSKLDKKIDKKKLR